MGYEAALKKAYDELGKVAGTDSVSVHFLNDAYVINLKSRNVIAASKKPVKDFLAILLLHYLIGTYKHAFVPSGEFISFKDIESGGFYYPAFREGAITPIIKKFGQDPEKLLVAAQRLNGRKISEGDFSVEIPAFDNILIRIILWKGDEEFAPEATMLFDRGLTEIYSTEDVAVLLRLVAHSL